MSWLTEIEEHLDALFGTGAKVLPFKRREGFKYDPEQFKDWCRARNKERLAIKNLVQNTAQASTRWSMPTGAVTKDRRKSRYVWYKYRQPVVVEIIKE